MVVLKPRSTRQRKQKREREKKLIRLHRKKRKRDEKEKKSLTDGLKSTFIKELESNSKSYDHCLLVEHIEVVARMLEMVVEVEVVLVDIVVLE